MKNIATGEEITYDYGKEYFEGVIEPIGCRCGKCEPEEQAKRKRTRRRDRQNLTKPRA